MLTLLTIWNTVKLRYKALVAVLLTLILALGLRHCGRPKEVPGSGLKPGERQHITVKGHSVTNTDKTGTTKQYAPDRVDISVSDVGTVKVKVAEFGVGLEPGAGLLYAGDTFKFFGDTRLAYYYRASLHAGLDVDLSSSANKFFQIVHPIVFANYSLPFLDGSMGAFMGYELAPTTLMGGLRWRF